MNITNASNKPRNAAKLAQEYKLIAEKKLNCQSGWNPWPTDYLKEIKHAKKYQDTIHRYC